MTATWASPMATQELLAGRAALDARGRLLLEHPLEGRAHLVQVGLRLRLDRHHAASGPGSRAAAGRSGRSLRGERVAGGR